MDRILQGTAQSVFFTATIDGTPTDATPDSALIRIVRANGTELVASAPAAEAGIGRYAYTLTPTDTALLDTLTVYWTAAVNGVAQTFTSTIEIVGGFLFTINELRAMSTGTGGLANATNYPADKLVAMRTRVEQSLEDACNVAFVPRYTLETVSGLASTQVRLKWPKVRAIRSATVDGAAVTGTIGLNEGFAYYSSKWTTGYGNVVIGYEHGYDYPPERIRQAALLLAKQWLTPTAVDDRAINMTNETGTYALFQAGVRGHQFAIPEVQAAVDQYDLTVGVA